ncbi:stage II sporulation protein D [Cohnella sp. GbtcB17]|uniref:stage II sporulation protein D n=1 Tax=Cohnella sp. GbtcB17 TaxID=2824762 RepID=UPI001C2FB870|nr:stage II sporulation protein D [Cohnella sp. GbtcB17]
MRKRKGQAGENEGIHKRRRKGGGSSRYAGFKRDGRRGRPSLSQWLVLAFGAGVLVASWSWADKHASERSAASYIEERTTAVADGSKAVKGESDRGGGQVDASGKTGTGTGQKAGDKAGGTNDKADDQADDQTKDKANDKANDKTSGASSASGRKAGALSAADAARGLQAEPKDSSLVVRIYLTGDKRIERAGLETYVKGVVAAEMPTDFAPAALEAQAIAARTYLIRRLWNEDRSGVPVRGADVTDTVTHQVYRSKTEMNELKESDPKAWAAVDEAVRRTRGIVMVYGDAPIESLYFASSNGYTENAKDVFNADLPYLVSVNSPWDREDSPRAEETVEMKLSEFYRKLGVKSLAALTGLGKRPAAVINGRTDGKRVSTVTVGGKTLSGTEIRKLLGLRSAAFDWTFEKGKVKITTYGSGHGVGMSQWGAEGMAKTGATAADIVLHYYTGIQLKTLSALAVGRRGEES